MKEVFAVIGILATFSNSELRQTIEMDKRMRGIGP
jgi:hypothetical protein